jgi:hypothetical protein
MRNFSSLAMIMDALEAWVVRDLFLTFEELAATDQRLLAELKEFHRSEQSYREAINSGHPCVPRLGERTGCSGTSQYLHGNSSDLHLHDLEKALPKCTSRNAPAPINFTACNTFSTHMHKIIKSRVPDLDAMHAPETIAYLKGHLRNIEINHSALGQSSNKHTRKEDKIRKARLKELHSLGF